MAYIPAADSIGVFSTTFTSSVLKATEFGDITQSYDYYAVQGRSRLPILVAIESALCDFLLVINSNLPPILFSCRDIASRSLADFLQAAVLRIEPPLGA